MEEVIPANRRLAADCVLKRFGIDSFDFKNSTVTASGHALLVFTDMNSGTVSKRLELPWWATTIIGKDSVGFWFVRKTENEELELELPILEQLENFIVWHVTATARKQPSIGATTHIPVAVRRLKTVLPDNVIPMPTSMDTSRATYSGPCVCFMLEESCWHRPFDWRTLTSGGRFPERCFDCSCGIQWWQCRPADHFWVRVADPDAWQMLLRNNGKPVETVVYFKDTLHLKSTLLKRRIDIEEFEVHTE